MRAMTPLVSVASQQLRALTSTRPSAQQIYASELYIGKLPPEIEEIKTRLEKHVGNRLTVLVMNDEGTPYLSLDGFGYGADTIREIFKTEIEKGHISFVATSHSGSGHFAPYY